MSKPIVLFGTGKIAEVVHHFMVHEAPMTGRTILPQRSRLNQSRLPRL